MSKMGQHIVREADSRTPDNASEVERLRADVAELAGVLAYLAGRIEAGIPLDADDALAARVTLAHINH